MAAVCRNDSIGSMNSYSVGRLTGWVGLVVASWGVLIWRLGHLSSASP